ncbi:MAG TPA: MBL fold metallo-hydrolase [Phycisphaerae bacterium]|nr:MBL fold metallo-hydrolase [Phycisphaerae bacterium]
MAYLRFHGAAQEVTGSMHLLEWNGHRVALDCGLFQGRRAEAHQKNTTYPCEPRSLTAVVLSHAHIDHSGKLPRLVKDGFDGPIFATSATRDLAEVMLADSAHIQLEDTAYFNKKRAKLGERALEPLYDDDDVQRTVRLFRPMPYDQAFEVAPGVRATFLDAGHLLGSAEVRLELDDGAGRAATVAYSGDLGRFHTPILRDPTPLPECDYLICETTYGGRRTGEPDEVRGKLAKILNETFDRGGKVIVPAFAVGRTQALVYFYHQMLEDGTLRRRAPLYIDSPLAVRTTDVFRRHTECYDREATAMNSHGDMLDCDRCVYIQDVEESKALHEKRGPLIILSASGMCETGRILHHLKNNCEDPKNTILIVGFQAANTLGRRLVEKAPQIKIFGEMYRVKARVEVLNGLSSHADAGELQTLTAPLAGRCRRVFLVHGEPDQSTAFQESMRKMGFADVSIPAPGERVEIA